MKTVICTFLLMSLPQLAWSQSDSYVDLEQRIAQLDKRAKVTKQEAERLEKKAISLRQEVQAMHTKLDKLEDLITKGEDLYQQYLNLETDFQAKNLQATAADVQAMNLRVRYQQFSDAAQRARRLLERAKQKQEGGHHSPFIPKGLQRE